MNRKRGRPPGPKVDVTVLKAASTAFSRLGYHRCSVQDILEESGVSRTHFYRYFDSKEDVYGQLVSRTISYFQRSMSEFKCEIETQSDTENNLLERVIERDIDLAFEAGPFLKILMTETAIENNYASLVAEHDAYVVDLLDWVVGEMGFAKPDPLLVKAIMKASSYIFIEVTPLSKTEAEKKAYCKRLFLQLYSSLLK